MDVSPHLWDVKNNRASGKSAEAQRINRAVDKIRVEVNLRYQELMKTDRYVTAAKLKDAYLGIDIKQETLLKLFEQHNAEFDECFDAVQKYYGEDKLEDKDNIRNLTLLDAQTNRGYGNAFFPIKRKWIISNDSQGIFVPIATKNVFLKYYTRKGSNLMVWDKTDAEDYVTAMEQTLREYLK